jgi:starch-binding outer membrane protein, SusD/RagB family
MKNYYIPLLLCIISLGCSEDFINRQPEDDLSLGTYFTNPAEIKTGLTGCYKQLQTIYFTKEDHLPLTVELMSDDLKDFHLDDEFHLFTKTNSDSRSVLWESSYKMIVNCNNIIQSIDNYHPLNEAEDLIIKAYRGEASFLRALSYFNLVRLYGDVPEVTKPFNDPNEAFGIGRTPVNEIYERVITPDLEFAVANCYKKGDVALKGEEARATSGAALTILGKVYLTLNDPAKAEETLKKLIIDKVAGNYSLFPNFQNYFLPSNKFNSESIFEVNYCNAAGQHSDFFRWMCPDIGSKLCAKKQDEQVAVEHNMMREFVNSNEKIRYTSSVDSGKVSSASPPLQPWARKLTPPPAEIKNYAVNVPGGCDYNYHVTRYSDALLMYAEALMLLNRKSEALPYINLVRTRSGMTAITDPASLNIDVILHERRMELAFEGHRYFDLVRTGKAIEKISYALLTKIDYDDQINRNGIIEAYQLLLPIPVEEIEKDPTLTQNEGY